ncbi:MAG TPA: hypothetical protein VMW56_28690 [Candidatus Margulisiibacteriota bacterium]|nr:hypothetical protein [Candidatus Margulisiibacteriota bacterium]
MAHTFVDMVELRPILPEIRALLGILGLDSNGYNDDALTEAVLAVCPVVEAGWPTDEQLRRVFERLTAGGL